MKFVPLSSAQSRRCRQAGFSLIELMVVIGIILLLAGLLVAALPGIQGQISRSKTKAFLAEIANGLSKYELEHGIYPQNPPSGGDRDTAGVDGSVVLYKHLSGDFNEDGEIDFDENETVYVPRLDFDSNRESSNPRSDFVNGDYRLIDPFGQEVRYLAEPPNLEELGRERSTINPTYDLWSIVDTDPGTEDDPAVQARHITNWQAQ
ncbi:MAG: prepilin-type N-terminal cleavage/methylation domain-containing protein [Verrucomicrobiota bacterium]